MGKRTYGSKKADIREHLLRQIEQGHFLRGTAHPSEREFTGQADASYMTVCKAIGPLIKEKSLEWIPQAATFVSSQISGHKVQRRLASWFRPGPCRKTPTF